MLTVRLAMLRAPMGVIGLLMRCSLTTITYPELPGLIVHEEYLDQGLQQRVLDEARRTSFLANKLAANQTSFCSPAHNIPIKSNYVPVKIPLEGITSQKEESLLSAEHFSSYGEGHRLTYFRGNENIPRLGLPNDFLDGISGMDAVKEELLQSRIRLNKNKAASETWRMTLNYYPSDEKKSRAGFPWHRDLEANGASTMILGLGSPGRLEFGQEPGVDVSKPPPKDNRVEHPKRVESKCSITLQPGSLLILTGQARWHFVHRVCASANGGERASIVYGVW